MSEHENIFQEPMKDQSRGRGHRERKNTGDGKKKAERKAG